MNSFRSLAALLTLALASAAADAQSCDMRLGMNSANRPLNFRDPNDTFLLSDVEKHHFQPYTEKLERGTSAPLPIDIAYTLNWYVNHYRALNSMAEWQLRHGYTPAPQYYEAECYFQRASSFTPNDPQIYLIWGNYRYKKKEYKRALEVYEKAQKLDPKSPEPAYNMGLVYVAMNDYERAKEQADRAYQLGHSMPGLRRRVEQMRAQGAPKKSGEAAK